MKQDEEDRSINYVDIMIENAGIFYFYVLINEEILCNCPIKLDISLSTDEEKKLREKEKINL